MAEAKKSYDLSTWNSLLQIDADIAAATSHLAWFGQRYVDDLADSYLAIGEKRYLAAIVAKIQRQAEDEARAGGSANPEPHRAARTANDNAQSTPRPDPQFDAARWNEIANEDPDIEAAIVAVGRFGSYYAADLAASFQAIGDKRYLKRIVETIVAEAQADLAQSTSAQSASSVTAETASNPESDPIRGKSVPGDHGQSARPPRSSAKTDNTSAKTATQGTRKRGADQGLAFTALGMFLFLLVIAAGLTLYDYSIFRAAQGNVDRLEAYESKCWICAFATQAQREVTAFDEAKDYSEAQGNYERLDHYLNACKICAFAGPAKEELALMMQRAADNEASRLRDAAIAADRDRYEAAWGDADRLTAYLDACQVCLFKDEAQAKLSELHKQANIAAARAAIDAAQRRQQQLTPQPNEPARAVTWRMTNSTQLNIGVQFFSETRLGQGWPGSNRNWPMNPGQTSDYNLACQTGEKICYGAAAPYRPETWGVGAFGTQGCQDCCVTCDGAVHAVNLITNYVGLE